MSQSKYSLINYLAAIKAQNYDKAITVLSDIIDKLDQNEKDERILCVKKRVKIYYLMKSYNEVISECTLLRSLGYNIEEDSEIAIFETEASYRKVTEETIKSFKAIGLKFNLNYVDYWASVIENIDLDKILCRKSGLCKSNSVKRRK